MVKSIKDNKKMKVIKKFVVLVAVAQLVAMPLFAQDNNAARKLARGLSDAGFCWVELGRQPMKVQEEEGDVAGVTWGVIKGAGYTVGRLFLGIYEIGTFILPPYRPLVEPEFIFSTQEEN